MELTQYAVEAYMNNKLVKTLKFPHEEEAKTYVTNIEKLLGGSVGTYHRYIGPIQEHLHCEACNKDLQSGDTYYRTSAGERFCPDCCEKVTIAIYLAYGEVIGDSMDSVKEFSASSIEE